MRNVKKNNISTMMLSIYAGLMIGIGGYAYLSVGNKIVGAFIFSFGLLTIVMQGFYLYTGKIGFVKSKNDILNILIIIVGNSIGTYIVSFVYRVTHTNFTQVNDIWLNKTNKSIYEVLALSIMCGILMYLAIDNYNKNRNIMFIIMPVMVFILSGFEHSIANMFYYFSSDYRNLESVIYLLINIIGNGIGAIVFNYFKERLLINGN